MKIHVMTAFLFLFCAEEEPLILDETQWRISLVVLTWIKWLVFWLRENFGYSSWAFKTVFYFLENQKDLT